MNDFYKILRVALSLLLLVVLILNPLLLLIIVVSFIFLHPYAKTYQIKSAVDAYDLEQLADYVDFPTLRQNLIEQTKSMMTRNVHKELRKNAFVLMGLNFANFLSEKVIDTIVTPAVIADLMKGSMDAVNQASQVIITTPEEQYILSRPLQNAKLRYKSISLFSILLKISSTQYIEFVLSRYGIDWKLSNIKFYLNSSSEPSGSAVTNDVLSSNN